ncbi:MAG TPA: NAD-dependent epimerase/dehydratase family protein [Rhodocyclaceae bacterium]|nr:NAD-dependent epimerase/dehydratase family protein [Rhodocyclaceae bacterium]
MKVLLFGATGMVGQGVLRECLAADDVDLIQAVGRSPLPQQHLKLNSIQYADMYHYEAIESELSGFDACFFCLGVSAVGKTEADYTHQTFDLTIAAATVLARLNPQMTFIYVSGEGTKSSEQGSMWTRVKGRTENALLRLPFKDAYMFRPGLIVPVQGVKSKTTWYRVFYSLTKPLLPLLLKAFPTRILTSSQIGLAMLQVARQGYGKPVLECADLYAVAGPASI